MLQLHKDNVVLNSSGAGNCAEIVHSSTKTQYSINRDDSPPAGTGAIVTHCRTVFRSVVLAQTLTAVLERRTAPCPVLPTKLATDYRYGVKSQIKM